MKFNVWLLDVNVTGPSIPPRQTSVKCPHTRNGPNWIPWGKNCYTFQLVPSRWDSFQSDQIGDTCTKLRKGLLWDASRSESAASAHRTVITCRSRCWHPHHSERRGERVRSEHAPKLPVLGSVRLAGNIQRWRWFVIYCLGFGFLSVTAIMLNHFMPTFVRAFLCVEVLPLSPLFLCSR